jgi:hypothetical protein
MKQYAILLIMSFVFVGGYIAYQMIFPEKENPNQFDFQAYTKERDDQIKKFLEEVK